MSGTIGTVRQPDKSMKLVAKVTDNDIKLGVPWSGDLDPIARALTRAAEAEGMSVAEMWVTGEQAEMYIWGYGNGDSMGVDYVRLEAARPTHVIEFIEDFDDELPVKPIQATFVIKEIIAARWDEA